MRHQGYELIIYLCIKLLEKVMGAASNIPSNVSFGTYDFNTFFNLYYNELKYTFPPIISPEWYPAALNDK